MPMTSRERVEGAIRFEKPDRVPFNFWLDRRRMVELDERYGANFRVRHYGADIIETMVLPHFPTGRFEANSGTSWMVEEAFQVWSEAARNLAMPDPANAAIYAGLEQSIKDYPETAHLADLPNVLTIIEGMRHQDSLYIDMLMVPDEVNALFARISDVLVAVAEKACKYDITALYVMDDVAYNNGMLLSPDQFRALVLPHWKKVIDVGHTCGKPVFFHTDGKADSIWDIFADELGIRMLNPIQPNIQSIPDFKRRFHGKMGVYGGLDTGRIHTFSPAQARQHVYSLFDQAGADGGLIMSSHDIDYSVSDETLDAMVAAFMECVY